MIDLNPGWLTRLGDTGTLLAMLLAGHVVADFIAQTDDMVRRKTRPTGLLAHGALVAFIHLVVVLPFARPSTLVVILLLATIHIGIDHAKQRLQDKTRLKATLFLADQALHLGSICIAWWLLVQLAWWTPRPLPVPVETVTWFLVAFAAYGFAWNGGGAIVRELLRSRGADDVTTPDQMGKLIGCLERWIVITLVLLAQWSAIAFVFAAKSIARFKQIEERKFAEYYLVGTLASLVVAVTIGLVLQWMTGA